MLTFIHISILIHVYLYICKNMNKNIYLHVHVHMIAFIYVCMYVYIYTNCVQNITYVYLIQTCIYLRIVFTGDVFKYIIIPTDAHHTHTHTHAHTHTHIHTHTRTHTHTHTLTHAYTHIRPQNSPSKPQTRTSMVGNGQSAGVFSNQPDLVYSNESTCLCVCPHAASRPFACVPQQLCTEDGRSICIYMYIFIYAHTCMYIYIMYICVCRCVYVCVCG